LKKILYVILLIPYIINGQSIDYIDNLKFYDKEKILYVIGENHFEENSSLQLSILEYLIKNTNIKLVFLEVPIEIGKVFDNYVNNKDVNYNYLKNYFKFFNRKAIKNVIEIVNYLKIHNQQKSKEESIHIKGIDLMSMTPFNSKKNYIKTAFPELYNVNTEFLKKTIFKKCFRKSSYHTDGFKNDFLLDMEENQDLYKKELGGRYDDFNRVVNQISLNNILLYRDYDIYREKFMKNELNKNLDTNSVSILFCGAMHALKDVDSTVFNDYPFASLTTEINRIYPNKVYSIIQQYSNKKNGHKSSHLNFLNIPMSRLFDNNSNKIVCVKNTDVIITKKYESLFDLIIISNTK